MKNAKVMLAAALETLKIFAVANMVWGTLVMLVCGMLGLGETATAIVALVALWVLSFMAGRAVRQGKTLIVKEVKV